MITPFAPREPKIAVADTSFNIDMDSMSAGLTDARGLMLLSMAVSSPPAPALVERG
jgi:hypothetical protein